MAATHFALEKKPLKTFFFGLYGYGQNTSIWLKAAIKESSP
jgi:hypothetical protein